MKKLLMVLACAITTGCASTYEIEYITQPRGANIVPHDQTATIGIGPLVVSYGSESATYMDNGCMRVTGVTAAQKLTPAQW